MLNYIWAGLIMFSLVFALANDIGDLRSDTYRNGQSLPVTIEPTGGKDVKVHISAATYASHFAVNESLAESYPATMSEGKNGRELRFADNASLPPLLAKIRDVTSGGGTRDLFKSADAKSLLATVTRFDSPAGANLATADIKFQDVRWASMQAISNGAMNFAKTAIELSLGLIGTLALFLGVMQIADKAGLINVVVRVTGPILRPLFPGIPEGHPAMGMVTLNLTANMLGLGNAATPFGIKAMEELQKLNRSTDTATNSMVMLLAMNTAGVQILPPIFLYAVMGLRAGELYIPILIVTGLSLLVAIAAAKFFERLPAYRRSSPDLLPQPPVTATGVAL